MPWRKGESGNPGGRTKKSWLDEKRRIAETRKSFQALLDMRDGMVLERSVTRDGTECVVVPSAKDYISVNREILDRCQGKPAQVTPDGQPAATAIGVITWLASQPPEK